jgi:hypothetical protein
MGLFLCLSLRRPLWHAPMRVDGAQSAQPFTSAKLSRVTLLDARQDYGMHSYFSERWDQWDTTEVGLRGDWEIAQPSVVQSVAQ